MDLVEHPLNPMDILRKSSELMQSGGFLLIWTPNGDFARIEKSQPITFRVDLEHMQYLTPDTCLFIASKLNLHVTHLETLGFPGLEGIDKPLSLFRNDTHTQSKNVTHGHHFKSIINSIPGFTTMNNYRHRLFVEKKAEKPDQRSSSYHLFCIMQKTA
jgi:hypothetical protein